MAVQLLRDVAQVDSLAVVPVISPRNWFANDHRSDNMETGMESIRCICIPGCAMPNPLVSLVSQLVGTVIIS